MNNTKALSLSTISMQTVMVLQFVLLQGESQDALCAYTAAYTDAMNWLTSAYSCVPRSTPCYIWSEHISA